jgi:hypothetical protein
MSLINRGASLQNTLLLLLVFIAGCSGSGGPVDPPVIPVAPVSGKVTFANEVPVGAQISLVPLNRQEGGIASRGVVQQDGTFKISTYEKEDGAPPGEYVVVVQWFKFVSGDGGSGAGPNVLPVKYASPETSPLKVTVKEGSNELPAITIPRA